MNAIPAERRPFAVELQRRNPQTGEITTTQGKLDPAKVGIVVPATNTIVEPELAARAAERATAEDIGILHRLITEMERKVTDVAAQTELDLAFHGEVLRAAGNRVCRQMFAVIHKGIAASASQTFARAKVEDIVTEHRAIYDAISHHEAAEARQMMTKHLLNAKKLFLNPA